ncbi:MAG TPA: VOC family protein [Patescibacteria group bacterium]
MSLHPQTTIGHVHLTVSNLERSLKFYRDLLGFEVMERFGDSAAFLSAGGYHHHLGLNTWQGKGVPPQPEGYAGLYHFAILFPTRKELAKVLKKLLDAKYPIEGGSDHGVSEAIYLRDPDNIGIELYCDRPRAEWPRTDDGTLAMTSKALNWADLLAELD